MAHKDDFVESLLRKQAESGRGCVVGRFLASAETPEELRAGILAALKTPSIYAVTIAEVISDNGFPCSEKPVYRHRSQKCACPKETN